MYGLFAIFLAQEEYYTDYLSNIEPLILYVNSFPPNMQTKSQLEAPKQPQRA